MAREVTFERESMELLRPKQVALLESTGYTRAFSSRSRCGSGRSA